MRRNLSEKNIGVFCEDIQSEKWLSVYSENNADSCFNIFHEIFMLYFEKHFPKKVYTNKKNYKNWVTNEIRQSSINLKKLFSLKNNDKNKIESYKELKRKHLSLIRTTKQTYYQNQIMNSKNFSKTAWKIINKITKKEKSNQNGDITIKVGNFVENNKQNIIYLFIYY